MTVADRGRIARATDVVFPRQWLAQIADDTYSVNSSPICFPACGRFINAAKEGTNPLWLAKRVFCFAGRTTSAADLSDNLQGGFQVLLKRRLSALRTAAKNDGEFMRHIFKTIARPAPA